MERELFLWQSSDCADPDCFLFFNIILLVPIGPYPIGTQFSSVSLYPGDKAELHLFNLDNVSGIPDTKFKLHYRVGEQIV